MKRSHGDKFLRNQIVNLKRKKIAANQVVNLNDFRQLKKSESPVTILVVDDDEVMRNALKRILERENYRVILAEDGMELSKMIERSPMDLILLDVNLPWVDGFELCRLIKSHHLLGKVPLILISARKGKTDIETGFAAGCTDYITKPFDVDHLLSAVRKAIPSDPIKKVD